MALYSDFDLIQDVLREQDADIKVFVYPDENEIVIRSFYEEGGNIDFRDIKFNIDGRMKMLKLNENSEV